jgi:hypothetical protein
MVLRAEQAERLSYYDGYQYNERCHSCRMVKASDPGPESFLPLPAAVFHILVAVAGRERHGYAIMQDVAARTDDITAAHN